MVVLGMKTFASMLLMAIICLACLIYVHEQGCPWDYDFLASGDMCACVEYIISLTTERYNRSIIHYRQLPILCLYILHREIHYIASLESR